MCVSSFVVNINYPISINGMCFRMGSNGPNIYGLTTAQIVLALQFSFWFDTICHFFLCHALSCGVFSALSVTFSSYLPAPSLHSICPRPFPFHYSLQFSPIAALQPRVFLSMPIFHFVFIFQPGSIRQSHIFLSAAKYRSFAI